MLTLPLALTGLFAALPVSDVERVPRIESVFPASETTIPANGRIVLFGGAFDAVLVLVREDGTFRELSEERFPIDGVRSALVVDLAEQELVVGETIRLEDRCDVGCEFAGTWTVEAADDVPPVFDDGPASIDVLPLRDVFGVTLAFRVNARLPGARDARSAVVGAWTGDDEAGALFSNGAFDDGAPIDLFATVSGGEARTVCFQAQAIDASGNETPFPDELCADLDPDQDRGCAQTSAASPALAAVALAFIRRRRRVARACRAPGDRAPS